MKLLTLVGDLFSLLEYEMDGNLYPGKDFSSHCYPALDVDILGAAWHPNDGLYLSNFLFAMPKGAQFIMLLSASRWGCN